MNLKSDVRHPTGDHMAEQPPYILETDELRDAIFSLEMVCETLPKVVSNVHHWKWAIISLHNALQGFMVLALSGSNGLRTLTENCARKWVEAYAKGDGSYPEERLDYFPSLYAKVKSDKMNMLVYSRPLVPTGTQDESVRELHELRNGFVHFVPQMETVA